MELESPFQQRKVSQVQFGVLSPEEIRKFSVAEITTAEMGAGGGFQTGGLLDLRMGAVERGQLCLSCDSPPSECPGHFGHIELVRPVFHPGFMKFVLAVLRSVCYNCSKLLSDKSDAKFRAAIDPKLYPNPKQRLAA